MRLLVATNNQGKVAELNAMLSGLGADLVSLRSSVYKEVEETGRTFAENAELKAAGYALQAGIPAIADDSGLVVDTLDGRPGIYSARYGGDGLDFSDRMQMILSELGASAEDRKARFICVISVADARGKVLRSETGVCEGRIAIEQRGSGGFGYDPIFIPDGFDETFGELSDAIKAQISHRARAFFKIIPFLRDFVAIST